MRARNLRRRRNRTRATREPSTLTLRRVATSKRRKEKREKIFGKILFFLANFTRAALLGHEAASIFLIVNGGALPNSEPNAVLGEKSRRARQTKGRKEGRKED